MAQEGHLFINHQIANKMSNMTNIPAELNSNSFIGDILIAYGICTRAQVDEALATQQSEAAALTDADKAGGKRSRFTGQILVDSGYATDEQVNFGLEVQKVLRGQK
jgi:hypothetical protein